MSDDGDRVVFFVRNRKLEKGFVHVRVESVAFSRGDTSKTVLTED